MLHRVVSTLQIASGFVFHAVLERRFLAGTNNNTQLVLLDIICPVLTSGLCEL